MTDPDQPPTFVWDGDMKDDCVCRSAPGYAAHVLPLTGPAARWLCELVVRAAAAGVYPNPPNPFEAAR